MRIAIATVFLAAVTLGFAADVPPALAPSFTMKQLGGKSVSFAQYRGKVLAVAFIFTTCPHCRELTNTLSPLAREYAPRGVQFLEVAFNGDAQSTMAEFLTDFHPPFPVGWSDQAAVRAILHYSPLDPHLYVPHMIFLDRAGVVRADFPGESAFFKTAGVGVRAQLDQMLRGRR